MNRADETSRVAVPWWNELFAPPDTSKPALFHSFLGFKKRGQIFLLLPANAAFAADAMQLYPAQRLFARTLAAALRTGLKLRMPVPGLRVPLPIWPEHPLVNFLRKIASSESATNIPPFAVSAGNASTAGRRFILLVWRDEKPAVVIKAGCDAAAQGLIEREENLLRTVPRPATGIPSVLDSFSTDGLRAFALPFVAGSPPPTEPTAAVQKILEAWIVPDQKTNASAINAWKVLRETCASDSAFQNLAAQIESADFAKVIQHGDFAPWNLRINSTGGCIALDWERGEFLGMPAWDWFHYVIQSGILVRAMDAAALGNLVCRLLISDSFQAYVARTGIRGREKFFLLAYLHHVVRVLRPTEGLEANTRLLEWFTANQSIQRA